MRNLSSKEILQRIAEYENVKTDEELGAVLNGKPKSTVSNWRRRNTIPIEEIATYCFDKELSFDWVLTGRERGKSEGISSEAAFMLLKIVLKKDPPKDEKLTALIKAISSRWPMDEDELKELVDLVI